MEVYGLRSALHQVDNQIRQASLTDIFHQHEKINWAFQILFMERLDELNRNIEKLTDELQRRKG